MDRKPTMAPGGPLRPVGAAEGGEIEFRDVWCERQPHWLGITGGIIAVAGINVQIHDLFAGMCPASCAARA